MKKFLRNYKVSVPLAIIVVGGLAWVAFGYFAVQKLFTDDTVSEAVPSFDAPVATPPSTAAPTVLVETTLPPSDTAAAPTAAPTTVPHTTVPLTTVPPTTVPPTTVAAEPVIVTEYRGSFVSREHDTAGQAIVLGDGSAQRFLRFEQFATSNGPDLNVYLVNSSTGDVSDFVDLGNLKGNIGDQNYEIPAGTDLAVYDTVIVWCVRFSANFGDAILAPA